MVPYLGDFAEDATLYIPFNTFDSNDPSASVTITNLAAADINIHKDGGLTQIATDGATIAIDYDSITGNHLITIDTSVHADFSIGSDYMVRLEGTTVDAATVNAWVAQFSIENRYNAAADDLANGTDGLGAIKADTAAVLVDTADIQPNYATEAKQDTQKSETVLILADTADMQPRVAAIETDTSTTLQSELDAIQAAVITNAAGTDVAADIIALKAETALIVADTAELQTDDVPGLIAALNDLAGSEGLTQVNSALDTAISELGVAAPTATPTIRTGLMLLYMALRNKTVVQTSGTDALEIYNNAGTIIAAKLLTDDGSDYTEAEMA